MLQAQYKRRVMERFMTLEELANWDVKYQAAKTPSANNLGQQTFNQLVENKVYEVLKKMPVQKGLGNPIGPVPKGVAK